MTLRKPGGMQWESWIDQQVQTATRKGAFHDLLGEGKPLDLQRGYDADWWIKEKMAKENLDLTPLTLRVRQKTEKWLKIYLLIYSEDELKRQARKLNQKITEANKTDLGPLLPQQQMNIDDLVANWRQNQKG